jgi:hypothetical protein
LTGHDGFEPVHVSTTSHAPADPRQATPALPAVWEQPVAGAHASTVQGFASSQFGAAPPTHVPALHLSFVVHALPSWHTVPVRVEHTPEALHA